MARAAQAGGVKEGVGMAAEVCVAAVQMVAAGKEGAGWVEAGMVAEVVAVAARAAVAPAEAAREAEDLAVAAREVAATEVDSRTRVAGCLRCRQTRSCAPSCST